MAISILAILVIFGAYLFATRCRSRNPGWKNLQGWNYAHRGLYGVGVPENSLKAFRRARDAGYGVELDVHLLSDGNLAVIHDATLSRVAGVNVTVEDLTENDLSSYYLEGTLETIPEFGQVLQLIGGKVPIIVELKVQRDNYAELCKRVCSLLDSYNGPFCMESFDPRCVRWLRKNRPDIIRGQLAENYFRSKNCPLPWHMKLALSYQLLNWLTLPDFVAYRFSDRRNFSNFLCRKVWRGQGVSWTLTTRREYNAAVKECWIPIFEKFQP